MPSSATTRRGMALFRAGRYGAATRALAAAHAEDPADPESAGWLAAARQRAGQPGAGLSVLGAALLHAPDATALWEQLGAALALAGRWREARYAAAEALRLEPGRPAAAALTERLEQHPERAAERAGVDAALALWEAGEAAPETTATLLECHGPETLEALLQREWPAGLARLLRELGVLAAGSLRRAAWSGPARLPAALSGLGRLWPPLARATLDELLADGDPEARAGAVQVVLALLPSVPGEYRERLAKALTDEAEPVWAALAAAVPAALTAVAAAGGEVEAVLAVLFDAAEHPARTAAAAWLGSPAWVATPVADGLLQRVLQGRDEALLATVLGGVAAAGETELLRRVFTTGGPGARRMALQGLAELGDGELVTVGLFDEVPAIRKEAAEVLARLADPQWLPALRDGLELETDTDVRAAIEAAVAGLTPAEEARTEEEEAP